MSTLPVLTTLCPICYAAPPKYRCPRCSMQTCCLECTKAHKLRASCSGTRDPAKYIPLRAMKSSTVDMDYNFLKSVQKSRDRGVEIIKSEAVNSRRKVALANRKRAIARAQEGGVNIRQLPKGMERMRSNQITWDSKLRCVMWTVEWKMDVAGIKETVLEHGISSETVLGDAFHRRDGPAHEELHYLLKKLDLPANVSVYRRLDPEKSILESLKGMTFIEYPTIHVVDQILENWTIESPQ